MIISSFNKCEILFVKSFLKELFYFNFIGSFVMLYGQFNNSVQMFKLICNYFNKLISLYDLSLFNFDLNLDVNINFFVNLLNF